MGKKKEKGNGFLVPRVEQFAWLDMGVTAIRLVQRYS